MIDIFSTAVVLLLIFSGIYFTFKSGFVQFRALFKKRAKKALKNGGTSPVSAMLTALGGSIGTANIAGVAAAIAIGGPGAVFWMWISGLLGMATKYAEVTTAMRFRITDETGKKQGGIMYCITKGLNKRLPAQLFSIFCILGAILGGGLVQSNTIAASAVTLHFGLPSLPFILSAATAVLCGVTVLQGAGRIFKAATFLVPIAGGLYAIASIAVLINGSGLIGEAFASIFKGAFGLDAAIGGGFYGMLNSMRTGMRKGTFSNEAGIGSAPIAHASVDSNDSEGQGYMGVIEVFIDTIVICTLTALVILVSGIAIPFGDTDVNGMQMAADAFSGTLGAGLAPIFLTVSIFLFAFTSIISWGLYGERAAQFLLGKRGILPYRYALLIATALGGIVPVAFAWEVGELLNLLMATLNIPVVLLLFKRE